MAVVDPGQTSRYREEAGAFLSLMGEMAPHTALDYSLESLQRLDQFISEHFEATGTQAVGETLPVGIGSYLGEVIIRHLGGHWNVEGKAEINDIGPLEAIHPIEKAMKRFENGRKDSLAWYYHAVAKQFHEAGGKPQPVVSHVHHSAPAKSDGGLLGLLKGLFKK